jgi:hypothetical protein
MRVIELAAEYAKDSSRSTTPGWVLMTCSTDGPKPRLMNPYRQSGLSQTYGLCDGSATSRPQFWL